MSRKTYPHVNAMNGYARDVVKGKTPACKLVRAACQRHLDDLEAVKRTDYAFEFSKDSAEHACAFIEALPHVKGKWASQSELLHLEPWQVFVVGSVFGWVHKRSGNRRYRYAYVEVPRKSGKSLLAAAVGLYMLAADGEFGAEVYCGATSEKQAWEVFRPARLIADRTPALRDAFGIEVGAKNLHVVANGSRFEPVIGKPGEGASPHCAIADEYHEHPTDDLVATMVTGMGAREQPLLLMTTTAGSNLDGPCYANRDKVVKLLEGVVEDPRTFGIIYTLDPEDDWTTDEALRKANPNYDVSVSGEFLRQEQQEAIRDSRLQNRFKSKHLNIWTASREGWMNMERWLQQGDTTLRLDDFQNDECFVGLDLASKQDITSAVKVFKRTIEGKDHFYVFGNHYVPEDRVAERPDSYVPWVKDGYLITTEGAQLDYRRVRQDLLNDAERFQIRRVGVDPYNTGQLAMELADEGLEVVEIKMLPKFLSDPMKWITAKICDGTLHHDGNPLMNWMTSNVTARLDANDNYHPRKDRFDNKIDGAVAMILAFYMALNVPPEPPPPVLKVWAF